MILKKDMTGMYPLCMIVGSNGQGMIPSQEDWVPGGHGTLSTTRTTYSAYAYGASYCVYGKNSSCSCNHSDPTNC
ncbi:hypothetical protein TNCV_2775151 [Trichonephila clavipes]|nr:hypothetical protein TNCV_2775151 [Trichonephila clavipes]